MATVAERCIGFRYTVFCILMVFCSSPFSLHKRIQVSDADDAKTRLILEL